jgi:predicted enzyme related to lactoylglutathione lyase
MPAVSHVQWFRGEETMIKGIKFASIPVTDQDRALEFYTQKLGFTILTDQPFGEQRWIELGIPGAQTGVVLFTPDEHKGHVGSFSHISFFTDDIEKTYQELLQRGVEMDGPPKKMPWGTFITFKDPDGNGYVLSGR